MVAAIVVVVILIAAGIGGALYYYEVVKAPSKPTITIGMPLPLNSPIGTNMEDAAALAVAQINAAGGVKVNGTSYQFKIITYDTEEADPSIPVVNGVNGVTALITQDHVNFLIGGYRSDVVDAELPIVAQYNKIYITFGADPHIESFVAGNLSTSHADVFDGFLNSTSQSAQYGAFPVYLLLAYKEHLIPTNVTNIAVLGEQAAWTEPDIGAGGTASPLYPLLVEAGFNPVYINYFPLSPPNDNYGSLLATLAADGTQAIYLLAAGTETPLLIGNYGSYNWGADANTSGVKPFLMGADVMSEFNGSGTSSSYNYYDATSGASAEEMDLGFGPTLPSINVTPSSHTFFEDFYQNYSQDPIFADGFVYSAFYYLAAAIEKAQSLSDAAIVPYLAATDYSGPAGLIKFSSSHGLNVTQNATTGAWSVPGTGEQWHTNGELYYSYDADDPLQFYNFETPTGVEIGNFQVVL
jgi:ABC-type branched-subunit amino acid transport system substrate-binding protein